MMYGKCENCGRNNYLTSFQLTPDLEKLVCQVCFKELARAKLDAQLLKINVDLKAELRSAFGKIGEK